MLRSLFILFLVAMMVAVGLYYERKAGREAASDLDSVIGTAVKEQQDDGADDDAGQPRSGVDLGALDRSTRAQDDFYQFANGGWLDATEIPEIYSGYTVYHEVHEEAERARI